MMEKRTKLGLSVAGFCVAAAALLSHSSSSLYPYLYVGVFVASLVLVSASVNASRKGSIMLVIGTIGLSVFLRAYTFLYPSSLIGMDPDKKAVSIQRVIETGSAETAVKIFYQEVPLFHVFGSSFGLVSNLNGVYAPIIYAVATGIVLPLTAVVLVRNMSNDRLDGAAVFAGAIASVETIGVVEGFWPHNQTIGILLWCGLLIVFGSRVRRISKLGPLVSVLLIAIMFAHKLPLLLISAVSIVVAGYVFGIRAIWRSTFHQINGRSLIRIGILSGILLLVQWMFLTRFTDRLISKVIGLLFVMSQLGNASNLDPAAAVEPLPPLLDIALWRGHIAVLLFFAGLAWTGWHLAGYRDKDPLTLNRPAAIVLGGSSVLAAAIIVGTFKPNVVPSPRVQSLSGPVFAALIASGIYSRLQNLTEQNRESVRRAIIVGIIGLLVFSQLFSLLIMIDHPNRPRMYLTGGEVSGKEFNHRYIPEKIYTDWYYSKEIVPQEIVNHGKSTEVLRLTEKHQPILLGLLNGSLNGSGYPYVSYRTKATVQRTPYGKFRLTWNPERRLNHQMNRVYDSENTVTFSS